MDLSQLNGLLSIAPEPWPARKRMSFLLNQLPLNLHFVATSAYSLRIKFLKFVENVIEKWDALMLKTEASRPSKVTSQADTVFCIFNLNNHYQG